METTDENLPKLQEKLKSLGYKCIEISSPAANTYTATLVQIKDNHENNSLKVFVKCLDASSAQPENVEFAADLYFANEVIFYGKIISEFLNLERRFAHNINIPFSCVSRCYNADEKFIILENLRAAGYEALDVRKPISYECACVVLQQLARFHAFSFALSHHAPQALPNLAGQLHDTNQIDDKLLLSGMQDALKLARHSFPKDSIYVHKLSYFILDVLKPATTQKPHHLVLTHGDLWPNNILCKLSDDAAKSVENAIFVDFQGCRLSSPINDLMSVMFLALNGSTRDRHRNELFECYYSALALKLEELGLSHDDIERSFSHSKFYEELQTHAKHAFALGLVGLPLYMQEDSNAQPTHSRSGNNNNNNFFSDESCAEKPTNADPVSLYFYNLRHRKSMKCKNKMLEIIMDVVDNGYL